jgi:integrase
MTHFAALLHTLAALWHLYSRMGLRRGEGLGLLWANVDWEHKTISVVQQYTRAGGRMIKETPKTKRSRRTFPVPDDLLDLLRQLQRSQRARAAANPRWVMTGLIFTSDAGQPLDGDWIYQTWRRLRDRLSLPPSVTIHDLRHTALYHMEQAGIAESIRMAFAGHSSAAMARKYADHAADDLAALRAALEKMG